MKRTGEDTDWIDAIGFLVVKLIRELADRDADLLEELRREILKGQIDLVLNDRSAPAALSMLRRAGLKT